MLVITCRGHGADKVSMGELTFSAHERRRRYDMALLESPSASISLHRLVFDAKALPPRLSNRRDSCTAIAGEKLPYNCAATGIAAPLGASLAKLAGTLRFAANS